MCSIDLHLTKVVTKVGEALPEIVGLLGAILQPVGKIATQVIEAVDDNEKDTS